MNVAQYFVNFLEREKTRFAFGMSGANIELVLEMMQLKPSCRFIVAKNEASAVYMADGYYKALQKPGVVLTTSGGGAFNLLAPLAECYSSRVPLLCVIGQPPLASEGKGVFQDSSGKNGSLSAVNLFDQVSVVTEKIQNPGQFSQVLEDCWYKAVKFRKPAVILLPKDIQSNDITAVSAFRPATMNIAPEDSLLQSRRLFKALSRKDYTRTMIILGPGAATSSCRSLSQQIAEVLDAGVSVTPDAMNAFPHNSERFKGVVGIMGHDSATEFFNGSPRVIFLGTRFSQISWFDDIQALREKEVFYINDEPGFFPFDFCGSRYLSFLGSIPDLLKGFIKKHRAAQPDPSQSNFPQEPVGDTYFPTGNSCYIADRQPEMKLADTMKVLSDLIPENSDIFADAGNTGASAVHYLSLKRGSALHIALEMGGMGYSFGASIGSSCASGKKTFVLAGDGAFYIHGLEIHTAVELNLPVMFIIFDNSSHGMCHIRESVYFNRRGHINIFKKSYIAVGMGSMFPSLLTSECGSLSELREFINSFDSDSGPALLTVRVSPEETPPFRPFLTSEKEQMCSLK